MRHYRSKATQAKQMFFIQLGLSGAFKLGAASSVSTSEFTVRYIKETRPGFPMYIETGIINVAEKTMQLLHMIYHHNGTLSATVEETVEHISLRTQTPFAWSRRITEAAKVFQIEQPKEANPRGLPVNETAKGPDQNQLLKLGAHQIGCGVFQPAGANVFGHITTQDMLGRCSETVGGFDMGFPELMEHYETKSSLSGVLLEIRGFIHRRPTPGDGFIFFSGLVGANENIRHFRHHLINPATGLNWVSFQVVNCLFDLEKRRHVKTTSAQLKVLKPLMIEGLTA